MSSIVQPAGGQPATMTSREIAELVETTHDSVLKTVRALVARGVVLGNETPYSHPQNGQTYSEFRLSYRDTMVVVSGYSVEIRARIIDRWQELEASAAPTVPKTLAQALRLAADQAEVMEQQAMALAAAAPKVDFHDRYTVSTGDKGFREVAKLLRVKENVFREFLRSHGVMYKLGREWVPYAQHLDAGRFSVKTGTAEHEESSHAFNQTKFTPKGIAWIAGEWAKHQIGPQ